MISLARIAHSWPREWPREEVDSADGYLIFDDDEGGFTAWRRNQNVPATLHRSDS